MKNADSSKTRWKQLIGRVEEIEKPLGEQAVANILVRSFVFLEFIKQVKKINSEHTESYELQQTILFLAGS